MEKTKTSSNSNNNTDHKDSERMKNNTSDSGKTMRRITIQNNNHKNTDHATSTKTQNTIHNIFLTKLVII